MATKIFVHGSGHKATSWEKTISYMTNNEDIVCPNLSSILEGKEASYENLYSSFVKYCNEFDGQIHLCGLSLGGILALNFALDFPQKVKTLVLIGTPYKVPKVAFSFQNIIFRFLFLNREKEDMKKSVKMYFLRFLFLFIFTAAGIVIQTLLLYLTVKFII